MGALNEANRSFTGSRDHVRGVVPVPGCDHVNRHGFRRWMIGVAVLAVLGGCGDDGGAAPLPPVKAGPTSAATPGANAGKTGNKLPEKTHIEDRVACSIPDQPTDPKGGKCDPKAPSCADHLYCLPLAQGNYCEPCPERDGIRHVFKDRDFVGDPSQNRDPFQSFLLLPFTPDGGKIPLDETRRCLPTRMVATSYSYAELKLVGIVAQGTMSKVLMMGGPLGYIIKRGDCVGKEKAIVKDIGAGYVTFQLDADTASAQRSPEISIPLNPKALTVDAPTELPAPAPRTVISPVLPPPATLPPRSPTAAPAAGSGAAGSGAAGSGTAVVPPVEAPVVPPKKL